MRHAPGWRTNTGKIIAGCASALYFLLGQKVISLVRSGASKFAATSRNFIAAHSSNERNCASASPLPSAPDPTICSLPGALSSFSSCLLSAGLSPSASPPAPSAALEAASTTSSGGYARVAPVGVKVAMICWYILLPHHSEYSRARARHRSSLTPTPIVAYCHGR